MVLGSVIFASPAYGFQTTYKNGSIVRTAPFRAFGNLSGIGDCQYEAEANLVLAHWPKAKISLSEVLNAYETYGIDGDPTYVSTGLWISQDFLMNTGFGGHKATSVTEIPQSQVIYAANHGGVLVFNMGPVRNHTFDMISANSKSVTLVDDGFVYHYSWKWLYYAYTSAPGQQGEFFTFYAVTWL